MLRVALFGSAGSLSHATLGALADRHAVVAVVCSSPPAPAGSGVLRRWARPLVAAFRARRGEGLAGQARVRGIPVLHVRGRGDDGGVAALLARDAPDVICVAGYRWLLPRATFASSPLGAINVHASLLPRHRGPWPLFWTYHADDRTAGVTVHRVDDGADTGPILLRREYPLPRGFAVEALNRRNVEEGAALMVEALDLLERGPAPGRPQDDGLASAAPRVPAGTRMVDFASWDVERVWHFLAGLLPRYREPLVDQDGRRVHYDAVAGFERRGHREPPGTVACSGREAVVHANGGTVRLRRVVLLPGRA